MKLLSFIFSLSLLFSTFFIRTEENLTNLQDIYSDLASENAISEMITIEEILNSFTEEEKAVLQAGFISFTSILQENLKNSEEYVACAELLKEKGLDISFFVNLVPSKN